MINHLKPHVAGTDLEDARMILQQAEHAALSGRLLVGRDSLVVRAGKLVRGDWRRLVGKLLGGGSERWSWRRVPGAPEADFELGVTAAMLAEMGA